MASHAEAGCWAVGAIWAELSDAEDETVSAIKWGELCASEEQSRRPVVQEQRSQEQGTKWEGDTAITSELHFLLTA